MPQDRRSASDPSPTPRNREVFGEHDLLLDSTFGCVGSMPLPAMRAGNWQATYERSGCASKAEAKTIRRCLVTAFGFAIMNHFRS